MNGISGNYSGFAERGGNIDEVKKLLEAGVNVNDKSDIGQNRGLTPLILVAQFGKARDLDHIDH